MITLTGILRQAGEVTIKERKVLKLVVEHETERDSGVPDLHLETLFVPLEQGRYLPQQGTEIHVAVRPYPSGRNVAYSATRVLNAENAAAVAA